MSEKARSKIKKLTLLAVAVLVSITSFSALVAPRRAHAYWGPSIYDCNVFKPKLHIGVQNQAGCVAAVQHWLLIIGMAYYSDIDGIYGPRTRDLVKVFQNNIGHYPNGAVDAKTWNAIAWICSHTPHYHPQCAAPVYR